MEARLRFRYDREADILYIDKCAPHAEQECEELGDEVIALRTGDVENLEVLRLLRKELFELPLTADLRVARKQGV